MHPIPRVAVLWCPNWSVAAAGCAADQPMVVLHANRVVARSQAAAADGVAVGMRRRQAQARCPAAQVVTYDPARDERRFEPVIAAIGQQVPRLEVGDAGTLAFIARGPARYFGGEAQMAEKMRTIAVECIGSSAIVASGGVGIGIGDGRFTAMLAARQSAQRNAPVIAPGGQASTAAYLAPLPTRTLALAGVPDDMVDLLQRLSVTTLGQVAAMSPAHLMARFGAPGVFAHTLAAAGDARPPDVCEAPPGCAVQHLFDDPAVHVDTVVFTARRLIDEMAGALAAEGRVCTRLIVTAETEHAERSEREWYRPTGLAAAAMVERVRWQLDAWAAAGASAGTVTAGITLLRLEPVEVRADRGEQLGLWGGRTEADEWAQRAVARLVSLSGQVLVPAGGGGRNPLDGYTWASAATADVGHSAERLAGVQGPWPGQLPKPSPAVVHAAPVAVTVRDAQGHVVAVSGRGIVSAPPAVVSLHGNEQTVAQWGGPWPIDERWWDAARARRSARFQLLTGDGVLLLVALERQQWWLLAEYA
jgi:protein ImuB